MLKRLRRLIMLGVLSVSMLTSNTLVFAADEAPLNEETQVPETEAPPETQPPETQAPETETPPETQPPETQAPETEAPPETQPSETQPSETQPAETQPSETPAPETQPSETDSEKSETEKDQNKTDIMDGSDDARKAAESEGIKNSPYATNSELIAHQHIVSVQPTAKDFRFKKVEASRAILKSGCRVYEEKNTSSRIVGKASARSLVYILADENSDFVYIESGECRGFVKKDDLLTGDIAEFILSRDGALQNVDAMVSLSKNAATTYTKTSVYEVVVSKDYAIIKKDADIYDDIEKENASVIGTISKNGLAYILKDAGKMYFVESANVRGFIEKDAIVTGGYADIKVSQQSEDSFSQAQEKISPENNKACYYTITSVKEADDGYAVRNSIVNFALQFVGNPYVWGGTSLTNGADCSGFVQSVYASFGYDLPRVACDQAEYGTQIPVSEAEPGDLIFYAKEGYVYHVSMYIGNGQVVQAYSTKAGIITSDIGPNSVWATKIL